MRIIKGFDIKTVPVWDTTFVTSSVDACCDWDRILFVEHYPEYDEYTMIEGGHCSCYGFDSAEWDATVYTREELKKLVKSWAEIDNDYEGYRKRMGELVIEYNEYNWREEK